MLSRPFFGLAPGARACGAAKACHPATRWLTTRGHNPLRPVAPKGTLMLRLPFLLLAALAAQSPIVPPGGKPEKLFDGGLVLTEGVAVAPDGQVYFSDITFSHVSREKL